jgi:hypothetical protein
MASDNAVPNILKGITKPSSNKDLGETMSEWVNEYLETTEEPKNGTTLLNL